MHTTQEKAFWKERVDAVKREGGDIMRAMGQDFDWPKIDARHKKIYDQFLLPSDRILDIGCGPGRLWGDWPDDKYVGIDFVPEFIEEAKKRHPGKEFHCINFVTEELPFPDQSFDWIILASVKVVVGPVIGQEAWSAVEWKLRRLARKGIIIVEFGGPEGQAADEFELLRPYPQFYGR